MDRFVRKVPKPGKASAGEFRAVLPSCVAGWCKDGAWSLCHGKSSLAERDPSVAHEVVLENAMEDAKPNDKPLNMKSLQRKNPYLAFDVVKGLFCQACRDAGHNTNWANGLRKSARQWAATGSREVDRHLGHSQGYSGKLHDDAVAAHLSKQAGAPSSVHQRLLAVSAANAVHDLEAKLADVEEGRTNYMDALHYLILSRQSVNSSKNLFQFLRRKHVAVTVERNKRDDVRKALGVLWSHLSQADRNRLEQVAMWTLHLDELSDDALGEVYVVGARFVDMDGRLRVQFLGFVCIPPDEADLFEDGDPAGKVDKSEVVFKAIEEESLPLHSALFSGSDGAPVIMGCHRGVVTRIKKQHQQKMVSVHCGCHRVSLLETSDQKEEPLVGQFMSLLNRSYWFQKVRPKWFGDQRALAIQFGLRTPLKLKSHCPTRWLYDGKRLEAFNRSREARFLRYDVASRKSDRKKIQKTHAKVCQVSKQKRRPEEVAANRQVPAKPVVCETAAIESSANGLDVSIETTAFSMKSARKRKKWEDGADSEEDAGSKAKHLKAEELTYINLFLSHFLQDHYMAQFTSCKRMEGDGKRLSDLAPVVEDLTAQLRSHLRDSNADGMVSGGRATREFYAKMAKSKGQLFDGRRVRYSGPDDVEICNALAERVTTCALDGLQRRFSDCALEKALKIFDVRHFASCYERSWQRYGEEEINSGFDAIDGAHIGLGLTINTEAAQDQRLLYFQHMKILLTPRLDELKVAIRSRRDDAVEAVQTYVDEAMQLWSRIHCPDMSLLLEAYRCGPANNACCERWFSVLRHVRGLTRLHAHVDLLNFCVGVLCGPSPEECASERIYQKAALEFFDGFHCQYSLGQRARAEKRKQAIKDLGVLDSLLAPPPLHAVEKVNLQDLAARAQADLEKSVDLVALRVCLQDASAVASAVPPQSSASVALAPANFAASTKSSPSAARASHPPSVESTKSSSSAVVVQPLASVARPHTKPSGVSTLKQRAAKDVSIIYTEMTSVKKVKKKVLELAETIEWVGRDDLKQAFPLWWATNLLTAQGQPKLQVQKNIAEQFTALKDMSDANRAVWFAKALVVMSGFGTKSSRLLVRHVKF